MKEKQITVVKVEPGKHPEVVMLNNDLNSLQKAVSVGADRQGLIELIPIDDETLLVCNEEGKLNGLEPNRRFRGDIICGTFYIVTADNDGNLASLSLAMQDRYSRLFWEPEIIDPKEIEMIVFYRLI